MKQSTIVWLTTNPVATWWIRNVASKLDPWIFRVTNGRYFSMGRASMPMLTLTSVGRRSGAERSVHLACLERDGRWLVVASAMGQEQHPAWSYNLEANPEAVLQIEGERFPARARRLSDTEKDAIWDRVKRTIPQMKVYETRTDRNIRVYELSRA